MSRMLKISLAGVGLVAALASGYYLGQSRSESFLTAHFLNAALQREVLEAHQERRLLEVLHEKRLDIALEVTQYGYYSRLLLAFDIAQQPSDAGVRQHLMNQLQPELVLAQAMQQKHPFRFASEADQQKWTAMMQQSK